MKLSISTIFVFIFMAQSSLANIETRRNELLKVLDEELYEISRLNKKNNGKSPDVVLRMGQVLLEKARVLRDRENQKFLEVSSEKRSEIAKEDYFKDSKKYFDQASKTVLYLLKNFPNFKGRGDAFYILAYNAKEQKNEEESKKYFQKALDESKTDSQIADKSRIALAEIYFNRGSFDKAELLYEAALKTKRDKWWTKDAFNLAWSYFKLGKYNKAIDTMLESYQLSKNNQYIDMTKSIERDIAYFFTEAGRTNDAVIFYKKNGKNASEVLLKVGKYLKSQGKFAASEKSLSEALNLKPNEKDEIEINLELLSLYERFGKYDKHLVSTQSLQLASEKNPLSVEQVEVLKFNAQKVGAILQQQVVSKTFDHQQEVRLNKAESAVKYFMTLAKIDPDKSAEYLFHAGETLFAMKDFDRASGFYAESVSRSKQTGQKSDKKFETLAGNALLVALGSGVKKETADKYLVAAYESYLTSNPKSDKSSNIYQRLFSSYLEKNEIKNAEMVLEKYHLNFPSENETQEKMIAKLMDAYRDSGDRKSLVHWSNKIDRKEYIVSNEYAKKVSELLLSIQFDKVEELSSKGNKKDALKGYYDIYKNPETTMDAKKIAAYNIAVIFYETGDWKQVFAWMDKALSLMKTDEIVNFEKDIIIFTTDLFQRRRFRESALLSEKAFDKVCLSDSKNIKTFYKNANIVYLAAKEMDKSKSLINKAMRCKLASEFVYAGLNDHLLELALQNKWSSMVEILKGFETNKDAWPYIIQPVFILANELELIGKLEEAQAYKNKVIIFYEESLRKKIAVGVESLESVASVKIQELDLLSNSIKAIELKFPEKEYNKHLKEKFIKLENLSSKVESVSELGSGEGILKSYRILIEAYLHVANEIESFKPEGKNADYVKSFQKSMSELVKPLRKTAQDFFVTAKKKIEEDQILSKENQWYLNSDKSKVFPLLLNSDGGVLMDKAGAK